MRTPLERFEDKYIPEPNSGCWLWTASVRHLSYGQFWDGESIVFAHRWSYEHHIGPVPKGLVLDHLCRVPLCVNPDHLEPVTQRENVLRGVGIPAKNIQKTHCPKGHPYKGDNLLIRAEKWRGCRTCEKRRKRKFNPASRKRVQSKCAFCKTSFLAVQSEVNRGRGKYCSHSCAGKNQALR